MLNTNPAGAEGAGEGRGGLGWGAEKVKIHLRCRRSFLPLNRRRRRWVPPAGISAAAVQRGRREVFAFLAVTVPFKPSWGPLHSPTTTAKAHPGLQERCSLFQSAIRGLSGWLGEFKAFREPTKDFLQLFSCLAGSRNPPCVNCKTLLSLCPRRNASKLGNTTASHAGHVCWRQRLQSLQTF